MSTGKKTLQGCLGLLVACAAALAVGTWVFPGKNDLIASFGGLRVSVSGIGAGLSLLAILGFANGWIGAGNRSGPGKKGAGRFWNGMGLGLMPGILIWKVFERHTALGVGTPAPVEFGTGGWLIPAGFWRPERIEMMAAAALFAAVILWLVFRKTRIPENGDLTGISLAGWGAVRVVTESLRANQIALLGDSRIVGWLACGVMAMVLVWWARRTIRQRKNTGYVFACVPVFLISMTGIVLIQNGIARTGLAAADLAMQAVLALLAFKAVICLARVSR